MNTIRTFQTHDAAGNPAPAEFIHVVSPTLRTPTANLAMDHIAPLSPVPTDQPGVYAYGTAGLPSGWIRFEEFNQSDIARVDDLLFMHHVCAALGEKEPFRNRDVMFVSGFIIRSNNPWIAMVIGAGVFFLGVWGFTRGIGTTPPLSIVSFVVGGALAVAGAVYFTMSALRVGWWTRARATAMRIAGRLPSDLTGL